MITYRLLFEGRDYGVTLAKTRADALYNLQFRINGNAKTRWYDAGRPLISGGHVITDRDMDADVQMDAGEQLRFEEVL